jgi:hypothetical protein
MGLRSDRLVLTTRYFKDQMALMLTSFPASHAINIQQTSAPFTMRAIGLMIAFLHPSDQRHFQLARPVPQRQHHFQ